MSRWRLVLPLGRVLILQASLLVGQLGWQVGECYSAPTYLGPTSNQEADFLWKEGQTALQDSRFQDAVNALQRLVDRYPGQMENLKAHFLLGQALLELGKANEALGPLQDFVSASGANLDAARARILIGRADLELKKFHEAYLTTVEIDRLESQIKLSSDISLGSLLVKAQSLLGLHHDQRAIDALEAAEKQLTDKNSLALRGQIYHLKLKLKILSCAQFPVKGPLDEGQIRDQLDRRGTCLQEALILFQKSLKTGDLQSAAASAAQINDSYRSYFQTCSEPPNSPAQAKRTPQQLRFYQAELTHQLIKDCQIKTQMGLELLKSWIPDLPPSMIGSAQQVSKNLEHLAPRGL